MDIRNTIMDKYIGNNGTQIASIVHDDPDAIEAFVKALRVKTNTPLIDWFYIVGTIALIIAIGDLEHIRHSAKGLLPGHQSISLSAVA